MGSTCTRPAYFLYLAQQRRSKPKGRKNSDLMQGSYSTYVFSTSICLVDVDYIMAS